MGKAVRGKFGTVPRERLWKFPHNRRRRCGRKILIGMSYPGRRPCRASFLSHSSYLSLGLRRFSPAALPSFRGGDLQRGGVDYSEGLAVGCSRNGNQVAPRRPSRRPAWRLARIGPAHLEYASRLGIALFRRVVGRLPKAFRQRAGQTTAHLLRSAGDDVRRPTRQMPQAGVRLSLTIPATCWTTCTCTRDWSRRISWWRCIESSASRATGIR